MYQKFNSPETKKCRYLIRSWQQSCVMMIPVASCPVTHNSRGSFTPGRSLFHFYPPQSGEANGFAMFNSQLFTLANSLALLCGWRNGVPALKMKLLGENGTYVFCDWYFASTGGSVIWTR